MALSDRWTLLQIRTAVRRELMDTSGRWWTDVELNTYIIDWQTSIQNELEVIWGSAIVSVGSGTSTLTMSTVASDAQKPGFVYWNGTMLVPRSTEDLDNIKHDWRDDPAQDPPIVVYQQDSNTVSLYPVPATAGTLVLEYPKILNAMGSATTGTDTGTMELPPWMRYSSIPYVCWRAYGRFGPNQDGQRSKRWRAGFQRRMKVYKHWLAQFWPNRFPRLRPGGRFSADLVQPILQRRVP